MNTFTRMLINRNEGTLETNINNMGFIKGLESYKNMTCDIYGKVCYGFIFNNSFYFKYNQYYIYIELSEIESNINMSIIDDVKKITLDVNTINELIIVLSEAKKDKDTIMDIMEYEGMNISDNEYMHLGKIKRLSNLLKESLK